MFTPTGMFEMVAAGLCRNDEKALNEFMEDVREYREIMIRHFESNQWFGSYRYITAQPVNEIAAFEDHQLIAASGEIPDSWSNQNNPVLDLKGVPIFTYRIESVPSLIYQSLVHIILMIVLCAGLIVLTQWSFNKYDVR